ncbi:uncharacterized protein PgNI_03035 [Pyricularia grisea]|uniref:Uncharacterized protein n=1 Tax=Pyricularia grisea TaxID=148305 RepID=A0A6P8B9L6_PYRGI|nr:uncharacterized protein PgNI_03035 [Pyricularia grisea]TLD12362.1 hypothetical protein PgNI_03035 [Pyricularia grisea]
MDLSHSQVLDIGKATEFAAQQGMRESSCPKQIPSPDNSRLLSWCGGTCAEDEDRLLLLYITVCFAAYRYIGSRGILSPQHNLFSPVRKQVRLLYRYMLLLGQGFPYSNFDTHTIGVISTANMINSCQGAEDSSSHVRNSGDRDAGRGGGCGARRGTP